jgi:hypothetical protein
MKVTFTAQLRVTGSGPVPLEVQLGRVMEELVRLGVEDPMLSGSLSTRDVEVSLVVDAPSPEEAVPMAMGTVRAAIHAAEGATPGWPVFDPQAVIAKRVDVTEPIDIQ